MKSLEILQSVLVDAQRAVSADTSRDFITIKSRHEHEGDSFLGITLPSFGSWIERSLSLGRVETSIYSTFRKKSGGKSVLPCFLHGLTSLVFDPNSGQVLKNFDVNAVFFIRQVCYLFKKVKALCSPSRVRTSLDSFVAIENSIRKTLPVDPRVTGYVDFVTSLLGSRLESAYRLTGDELPRHGPGATSDSLRYNAKFQTRKFFRQWSNAFSLEEIYGYQSIGGENASRFDIVPPVKVIAVPKTMKVARIIAVEDTAMQFAQQYVSSRLIRAIELTGLMSQLNLSDQRVNQHLALEGSLLRTWATLDLSEASDRLTAKFVHHCFRDSKEIRKHLFACRTPTAVVHGRVLPLRKFASMGSALTFPVESYAFYCIAVSAVLSWFDATGQFSRSPLLRKFEKAEKLVYVFGDDIIVPSDATSFVIRNLEAYGLKVNEGKSFSKGPFRESCGTDSLSGVEITPVYIRSRMPRSMADATEIASIISTCNQMFLKGLWYTADKLKEFVDNFFKFPLVSDRSNVLGWRTYQNVRQYDGYRNDTSHPSVRSYKLSSSKLRDTLDGYDALLKCLTSKKLFDDPSHLLQSTSRYSVKLRRCSGIP